MVFLTSFISRMSVCCKLSTSKILSPFYSPIPMYRTFSVGSQKSALASDNNSSPVYQPLTPRSKIREIAHENLQWYPGHMTKGARDLNRQMVAVQCIIEVHDARIPLTGRSSLLGQLGQVRPKILILNKVDLVDKTRLDNMLHEIRDQDEMPPHAIFLASFKSPEQEKRTLRDIMSCIHDILNRDSPSLYQKAYVMVAGIPNVGKSTVINALRNWCIRQGDLSTGGGKRTGKSVVRVGRNAGVTLVIGQPVALCQRRGGGGVGDVSMNTHQESVGSGEGMVYLYDSPGILEPRYRDVETLLKLGVCGCLNLDQVDVLLLVDYLLYWLNSRCQFRYVSRYGLQQPTDDVLRFLQWVCASKNLLITRSIVEVRRGMNPNAPDLNAAAMIVLRDLASGALGEVLFDDGLTSTIPFAFIKKKKSMLWL